MPGPPWNHQDHALDCKLVSDIDTSESAFDIERKLDGTAPANWPTADFLLTLRDDQGNIEVINVASRSGKTITPASGGRGYGTTSAFGFSSGATAYHSSSSEEFKTILVNLLTQKGAIPTLDENGNIVELPPGNDDEVLTVDAAVAEGLKYASAGGGGGGAMDLIGSAVAETGVSQNTNTGDVSTYSANQFYYHRWRRDDGKALWMMDPLGEQIIELTVSTAYDITTITGTGTTLDLSAQFNSGTTFPYGFQIVDGGSKIFIVENDGGSTVNVQQWDLGTAYDLSTATFTAKTALSNYTNGGEALAFGNNGTKLWVSDTDASNSIDLREYDLGTAYDITTLTDPSITIDLLGGANFMDLKWIDANTLHGMENTNFQGFSVPSDWDPTSATHVEELDVSLSTTSLGSPRSFQWGPNGDIATILDRADEVIYEYDGNANAYQISNPAALEIGGITTNYDRYLLVLTDWVTTNIPSIRTSADGGVTWRGSADAGQSGGAHYEHILRTTNSTGTDEDSSGSGDYLQTIIDDLANAAGDSLMFRAEIGGVGSGLYTLFDFTANYMDDSGGIHDVKGSGRVMTAEALTAIQIFAGTIDPDPATSIDRGKAFLYGYNQP